MRAKRQGPPAARPSRARRSKALAEPNSLQAAPKKKAVVAAEHAKDRPKLHKLLAQSGLGSRRQIEDWIAEGRISVNGRLAHVGQRVRLDDHVRIDGRPVHLQPQDTRLRLLLYHKPAGELVTRRDPRDRPTVFSALPRLKQSKWQAVGRLDLNTEGLLLITNSGELAHRLMHPRFGLEREYAVRVLGGLTADEQQQLLQGVELSDGKAKFSFIRTQEHNEDAANRWYRVGIEEGRNREVRRMIETQGRTVSRLIRVRYGPFVLPRGLRRGQWLELDEAEVQARLGAPEARKSPAETYPDRPRHKKETAPKKEKARSSRKPALKSKAGSHSKAVRKQG